MNPAPAFSLPRFGARIGIILGVAAISFWIGAAFEDKLIGRTVAIVITCLVLWLSELVPLYATTLLLLSGVVLLLGPIDPKAYSLKSVMEWTANPVMALFFGGFALSAAASKHGLDMHVVSLMLRISGRRRISVLFMLMLATASLSMWISNIAAAAMMLATIRPLLREWQDEPGFRKAMLLGIAFAADFGGMGTPLGTGPNLIAIAAVEEHTRITFGQWMVFGVPLAMLMTALAFGLLMLIFRVRGDAGHATFQCPPITARAWIIVGLFAVAVALWLLEPFHGIPAALVALALAGVLFASRLLDAVDLQRLEWDTMMLIAGGLALGELFETSGLAHRLGAAVDWHALSNVVFLLAFVFASALFAAIASNTAGAAILIPIGLSIITEPSFAILVAMGASMGVPFVISTPPNAMVYNEGSLRPRDIIVPGSILMIVGCLVVALTGPFVLRHLLGP